MLQKKRKKTKNKALMRQKPPLFIRLFFGWLPALVCAGLIVYLSSRQARMLPAMWFAGMDKIIHAMEYGALSMLIFRAFFWPDFRNIPKKTLTRACIYIVLFCAFFAFTDEVHQSYVPRRAADFWDWVADVFGASLALAYCWYCFQPRSLDKSPKRFGQT